VWRRHGGDPGTHRTVMATRGRSVKSASTPARNIRSRSASSLITHGRTAMPARCALLTKRASIERRSRRWTALAPACRTAPKAAATEEPECAERLKSSHIVLR